MELLLNEENNKNLEQSQQVYKLISDTSNDGFVYRDHKTDKILISDKFRKMCGVTGKDELEICRKFHESIDEEYVRLYLMKMDNALKHHDDTFEMEVYLDTTKRWLRVNIYFLYDSDGKISSQINYYKDITDYIDQKQQLEYWAYYDILTGLYNRNYFYSTMENLLQKADKEGENIFIMYVDIDDFKKINDSLGFEYGDELVVKVSEFLKRYMSERVHIARFNSDEFVIGIYGGEFADAKKIYDELKLRTTKHFVLNGGIQVFITFSVGVVKYPQDGKTVVDLIGNADIAMCNVKENGKNGICLFENSMVNSFIQNARLESLLKKAIQEKKFELYYQPQFDAITKELRGFEALIRWNDEAEGFISPNQFIPLAEKNGSIIQIGDWVLRQAFSDYVIFRSNYGFDGILSINISAIQFKEESFETKILDLVDEFKIEADRIELEITESIFIGLDKRVLEVIDRLRARGIKISLDDFGTGYSSLSYLKNIPIDTLKIDKSFIDTMLDEETTRIITSSIVSMVQKLGFETIAEGVETAEQLEYLKKINCKSIQGFLLGKPMSFENACKIL